MPEVLDSACHACNEKIEFTAVAAAGHRYHPECFVCQQCLMPFPDNGTFFEAYGKLHCETDYSILYGERCARCCEIIFGKCITALEMKWHPDHFTCEHCNKPLAGTSFIKRNGKPFCKPCNSEVRQSEQDALKSLCARCKKPITSAKEMISFKGGNYHASHFSCQVCGRSIKPQAFKELDGKLYCLQDFNTTASLSCFVCRKPIFGRSVTALGRNFHPEHFVCFKCEKPFTSSIFYEFEDKAYCELHYSEVAGAVCGRCFEPTSGRAVSALGRQFCENHFRCEGCETDLGANLSNNSGSKSFVEWDTKPLCKRCYDYLPIDVRKKLNKYSEIEQKALRQK